MWNSRTLDYRIPTAFVLSLLAGLFLTALMPMFVSNPVFLLALPMGGLFFILMVTKPEWALMIMLLIRPLLDQLLNMTKIRISGEEIGIGAVLNLVIIILAVFLIFYRSTFPRRERIVIHWVIFLVLMLAACLYSSYQGRAIRLYFNYLSYFAMFLLPFLVIKNKKDWQFWFLALAGSFLVPMVFANLDLLQGGRYFRDAGMRIMGTFTHPNILAFYLVLGLTVYFYLLKDNCWKWKNSQVWTLRILMANMVILLVATKTRNAWIAGFLGFFIYGLLKDKTFLLALLLAIPLTLLIPSVQERVLTATGAQITDYQGINSLEWRLEMWKSSLPKIAEKPLQGHGLTSFRPLSEGFSDVGRNMGAHNVYLELLFETGVFGLLSFLTLFLTPLRIFLKKIWEEKTSRQAQAWAAVVGYIISYLIICTADNLLYYLVLNWYVWFFLGMLMIRGQVMRTS